MSSETTTKYKKIYIILLIISWVLVLGPLIGYFVYAMIVAGTVEKAALVTTLFIAVILTAASILMKFHVRSTLFIMILGIYIAIQKITILLIIISICTILDEFLITPLAKSYKAKFSINKEIDKRIDHGES